MDIVMNNSEEQKTHHILRIIDIGKEPVEMLPPISGYEDMPLVELEIAVEPLLPFLPDIQSYVSIVKERCRKSSVSRLSNDESASIMLYTMGWKPVNECLYVVLNETLRSKERDQLEPWFLYLKLFVTALSRLPSIQQTIYCGLESDLTEKYKADETVIWWGFSSCTTSTEELLNTIDVQTLFSIECISGKDIHQHSYFELENEIILFPVTQFKVRSCSRENNDVHLIELEEIQPVSPLLYPNLLSSVSIKPFSNKLIYVGNYDFDGLLSSDELSFYKGDQLQILDKYYRNKWWKAKNLRTKQIGYIPSNYISPVIDLTRCEWYFTETNRYDAEDFLERAHNGKGTFIIRPSETHQDEEVLSILDFNEDKHFYCKHYRIRRTDQRLYYITRKITFSSLQDLVNHYQTKLDGLCSLLTHPCQKLELIKEDDLAELDRSQIFYNKLIHQGSLNKVHQGKYGQRDVAIKHMEINNKKKFLQEAKIMEELLHKNVVRLYGVCTLEEPILIITEFVRHGSLLNYLRNQLESNIQFKNILDFVGQILKGMIYLEENKYIHCDLAARNIFLGESNIIKIGGFSSAKILQGDRLIIDDEDFQCAIKWAAPEVATKQEYTIKSDVWSFAILLYELITYGSTPYPTLSDNEVLQRVLNGYRMIKPNNCHEEYYRIMSSCWQDNPQDRPTFQTLSMRFDEFIIQADSIYQNEIYTEL